MLFHTKIKMRTAVYPIRAIRIKDWEDHKT